MGLGAHGLSHTQSEHTAEAFLYTTNLPGAVRRDGSTAQWPEAGLGYLSVLQKELGLRTLSCHHKGITGMVPWRQCPQ